MSGSIGDPFAFGYGGGADQSGAGGGGFLGQSPNFWQHLAMFGGNLSAAANARTPSGHLAYGSGFAGPFGAAIGTTMQQGMEQARYGAGIQNQLQEAQGRQLQNRALASSLPLQEASNKQALDWLQHPENAGAYMQQMMGGYGGGGFGAGPFTSPGSAAPVMPGQGPIRPMGGAPGGGGAPSIFNVKDRLEYNGDPNAIGVTGDGGQAGGPSQVHQGALDDYNKANGTNYKFNDLVQTKGLSKQVGDWYLNSNLQRYGGDPIKGLAAYNAGPDTVDKAFGPNGGGFSALPPATQQYVMRGQHMMAGGDGQITSQSAIGMAQSLKGQADQLEFQQSMAKNINAMMQKRGLMGPPVPPGDPALMRQMAMEWLKSGISLQTQPAIAGLSREQENQSDLRYKPQIAGSSELFKRQADIQTAFPLKQQEAWGEATGKISQDREGNAVTGVMTPQGFGWVPLGRGSRVGPVIGPDGNYYYGDVGGRGIGDPRNIGVPIIPGAAAGGGAFQSPMDLGGAGAGGGRPAQAGALPGEASRNAMGMALGEPPPQMEKYGPTQQEYLTKMGGHIAEDRAEIDEAASASVNSNYLFDLLRSTGAGFQMGKFADISANASNWVLSAANLFGVGTHQKPGNEDGNAWQKAMEDMSHGLSDYTTFQKSAGILLREAVHETSSRAALQEYRLIGETLPTPQTPEEGFHQMADEWQGLNDYRIAKQAFANRYRGDLKSMTTDMTSALSPTSFFLNRAWQSPEGKATVQRMFSKMSEAPEGRLQVSRMLKQYTYAKDNGFFDFVQQTPTKEPPLAPQ